MQIVLTLEYVNHLIAMSNSVQAQLLMRVQIHKHMDRSLQYNPPVHYFNCLIFKTLLSQHCGEGSFKSWAKLPTTLGSKLNCILLSLLFQVH